ncbi:MAG: potassium channel family protein [Thermoleophilaceae bacterium]
MTEPRSGDREAGYRYGLVLLLAFVLVVFQVLTSGGDWSRAVVVALQGAALIVVIATSRERSEVRHARATAVGIGALLVVAGVAAGVVPDNVAFLVIAVLNAAIPLSLVTGLLRLVRSRGVTVQAVAGALAIYLLVGLLFAAVIGFVARVDHAAYFAQGTDGSSSDRVYFSFTVLTTTGFGDFTAATTVGRAIAVIEMLLGQIYLVTVIGILVGNLARRQS